MIKYIVIGLLVIAAIALVRKLFGHRPKEPVPFDRPKMITVDDGATAAEIAGQELDIDEAVMADIRALIASGNKIEAIKRLREATGLDLTEAKRIVDSLEHMKK
jgi:hypothetical protein